uniref:NAD(P)H-hydrate epimerase n=1 Tax=Schlesneria paludicola TaxID=360056 RepID=A0A7C2JZ13_9PLAN
MPDTCSLTRAQVREIDRRAIEECGLPGVVLMENAGRNTVELLDNRGDVLTHVPVVIVCGKGNNAGDGCVIARHLENRGFEVQVLLAAPASSFTGDAAIMYRVLERAGTPIRDLSNSSKVQWISAICERGRPLLFDALLGTGLQGAVREPFATAISAINECEPLVVAVDIPSGLDCDTGRPLGCAVKAGVTVTYVARKIGFDAPGASDYTGDVIVADIGVPRRLLDEL